MPLRCTLCLAFAVVISGDGWDGGFLPVASSRGLFPCPCAFLPSYTVLLAFLCPSLFPLLALLLRYGPVFTCFSTSLLDVAWAFFSFCRNFHAMRPPFSSLSRGLLALVCVPFHQFY